MMKKSIFYLMTIFIQLLIPLTVLAHGNEEHVGKEVTNNYWTYGLVASLLIVVIALALLVLSNSKIKKLNLKTKTEREKQQSLAKKSMIYKWILVLSLLSAIVFTIVVVNADKEDKVTFKHIHGLDYTGDGQELYVPAHDGLRIYTDGHWAKPKEGDDHDYMGFSMVEDGFYSSGHPDRGSNLPDPLGIVKSTDGGRTIEKVSLVGEVDFHGMTVGYETKEIYVFNPAKNSQMDQPGFYYSTDEAKTWNQGELNGLNAQAMALAAHPTQSGMIAIGTKQGIFLSDDYGDTVEQQFVSDPVSAVSFGHQDNLLVATYTDKARLLEVSLSTSEVNERALPELQGNDAITYVKQNPVNNDELVFVTNKKDIYFSYDRGETWEQSVDDGVSLSR